MVESEQGHIAVGWLVVEDIAMVLETGSKTDQDQAARLRGALVFTGAAQVDESPADLSGHVMFIFGTYDDVLQNAGPVGIWLWIAAAIGQTLVALVIAQFAARISLSGSSYQWASRLANPKLAGVSAG